MNCPVQVAAGSEADVTAHSIPKCQPLKTAHSAPSQRYLRKSSRHKGKAHMGRWQRRSMEGEMALMMYRGDLLMDGGTPCLRGVLAGLWPVGDPHQSRDTLEGLWPAGKLLPGTPTAFHS